MDTVTITQFFSPKLRTPVPVCSCVDRMILLSSLYPQAASVDCHWFSDNILSNTKGSITN